MTTQPEHQPILVPDCQWAVLSAAREAHTTSDTSSALRPCPAQGVPAYTRWVALRAAEQQLMLHAIGISTARVDTCLAALTASRAAQARCQHSARYIRQAAFSAACATHTASDTRYQHSA